MAQVLQYLSVTQVEASKVAVNHLQFLLRDQTTQEPISIVPTSQRIPYDQGKVSGPSHRLLNPGGVHSAANFRSILLKERSGQGDVPP